MGNTFREVTLIPRRYQDDDDEDDGDNKTKRRGSNDLEEEGREYEPII